MNAHHVRPLLAYWLLVLVAALIASLGMRAGTPGVDVPRGSPTGPAPSLTPSQAPGDVAGGLPRPQPATADRQVTQTLLGPLSAMPVEDAARVFLTATGTPAATPETVAAGALVAAVARTTTRSGSASGTSVQYSAPSTATTTATTTATSGPGKGHGWGKGRGHRLASNARTVHGKRMVR